MKHRWRATWGEMGGLVPLMAIALLIGNDHWGKPTFHNAVTGKLSDVAICFLLPLLFSTVWGVLVGGTLRTRLWGGGLATAALFTLLELSDSVGTLYVGFMGLFGRHAVLTRDLGDLYALAMIPVAILYASWKQRSDQREAHASSPRLGVAGLFSAALGSLALMADQPPEPDPLCDVSSPPVVFQVEAGCGEGGLMVVEGDKGSGHVRIYNRPVLGVPEATASNPDRYVAGLCPFQLEDGGWEIRIDACQSLLDAGSTLCVSVPRLCKAEKEGSELWFICRQTNSSSTTTPTQELCRSRLTVVP